MCITKCVHRCAITIVAQWCGVVREQLQLYEINKINRKPNQERKRK